MALVTATKQHILFCGDQVRRPESTMPNTGAYLYPFSQADWLDVIRQLRETLEGLEAAIA